MADFSTPQYLQRQFMGGMILLGLIVFAGWLIYDFGLWAVLLAGDKSYISVLIIALWLGMSARWLWLLYHLQRLDLPLPALILAQYRRYLNHGWFGADLALKLGLVGTIVGFIFMLSPLGQMMGTEPAQLRKVLIAMGDGMAVALYTTLTGLIANILLRLQYQLLGDTLQNIIERPS